MAAATNRLIAKTQEIGIRLSAAVGNSREAGDAGPAGPGTGGLYKVKNLNSEYLKGNDGPLIPWTCNIIDITTCSILAVVYYM